LILPISFANKPEFGIVMSFATSSFSCWVVIGVCGLSDGLGLIILSTGGSTNGVAVGVAVGEGVAATGLGDAVAEAVGEGFAPTVELGLAVAAEPHAVTNTATTHVIAALRTQKRSMVPPLLDRQLNSRRRARRSSPSLPTRHVGARANLHPSALAQARACDTATSIPAAAAKAIEVRHPSRTSLACAASTGVTHPVPMR
jgi:hypothetical protein